MIAEQELIEQIDDNVAGRRLEWACGLLASLGKADPLAVLCAMHREGLIELRGSDGAQLAAWQCQSVFRGEPEWAACCSVAATEVGSGWAWGKAP